MLLGHYSSAFAAKALVPRVPLWSVLLAAQLVDIFWVLLVLGGVEHVRLVSDLPSNPLDLYDMPYTHSLVATVAWSLLAFAAARRALGLERLAASAVAAVVASHWLLDLVVHRPDLPIGFGVKVGLAMWNYPVPAYLLEIVLIVASAVLAVRANTLAGRALTRWVALTGGLVLLQTGASFGPFPSSLPAMILPAFLVYLLIPCLGAFVERWGGAEGRAEAR